MSDPQPSPGGRIRLRKYPNRRYYDATRSRHVTLEAIHRLILDGYDVEVVDSKTGELITARVLTQIILEHDPPKLEAFPAELLHQVIRANEPLVRDFVEKYFSGALTAFLESQRQFERYLREALGLESSATAGSNWARMMLGPFAQSFFANGGGSLPPSKPPANKPGEEKAADLRDQIEALRRQVVALREELGRR
jgi:polyhydroxyalkanoate synthesis repressor PhaR